MKTIGKFILATKDEINELGELAIKRYKARSYARKNLNISRNRMRGPRPLLN